MNPWPLVSLVFAFFWSVSQQTVDLNLRQLQYVSDHLTIKECRRLITALYQKSFQLTKKQLRPVKDHEPCLMHLSAWNKESGDGGSVEDLTIRLHQIGRTQLAREIAQAVYGETAREIHKYFLDNPFHETAHLHGSRLMEDDEEEEEKTRKIGAVDHLRNAIVHRRFALAVVTLTLTMTCLGAAIVRTYCPGACSTMCPKRLVVTCEAIGESVKESVDTLKALTAQEILGTKRRHIPHPPPTHPVSREEQDRLVQNILAV